MGYLFTSESVSEGHPDKVADQISDAILDDFLRKDPRSKVACETLVTTGLVVIAGEVRSEAYVDVQTIAREVINRIGYTRSEYMFDGNACGILSAIHEQSPDINQGVVREQADEQGAGDQGIMFGYACTESKELMPAALMLSHIILQELAAIRREGREMTYLRPDAKSQVTIEYSDDHRAQRVHTIVVSTQHDEFITGGDEKQDERMMQQKIKDDVLNVLMPRVKARLKRDDDCLGELIQDDYILHVNPTGKFVIGGPHGDTGLTGRKIIVDSYGGRASHGGGAFSGKDSSKVDRSAAYAVRHIAKNMVAAGIADQMEVQVAYAIGIARPVSIFVNTKGTARVKLTDGQIAQRIDALFDLRPAAIVRYFGLTYPIFETTAAYGHFGHAPYRAEVTLYENGQPTTRPVDFYAWEKLDAVEAIKTAFADSF
ncbi:MAG: methionine adenosyltransferase [Rikenellaceae bacterium]|jgi:S-adenosylmethionine synthetase|nr:methionine adenosyltransferase [Rikenellaceae bacterium]